MPRRGGLLPVEITSEERRVPTEAVWHGTRTVRETRLVDAWRKDVARQIEVRPAPIVEETTQLIEVVHHADVGGLAVRVAGATAVRQLTVVSPLVHERARLHERGATWLTFGIAECAQRHEDVGAGVVRDAGVGAWHVEVGVVSKGSVAAIRRAVGRDRLSGFIEARLVGLREPDGVAEEGIVERVVTVAIEPPHACIPRRIARVVLAGNHRRPAQHFITQVAEAGLPANRAGIAGELAHPRRIVRRSRTHGRQLVDRLAALRESDAADDVRVGVACRVAVPGIDVECDARASIRIADRRRGERVANQFQCSGREQVAVRRLFYTTVGRMIPGIHVSELDEEILVIGIRSHGLEVGKRLLERVDRRNVRGFPDIEQPVVVAVLDRGPVDDCGPGQAIERAGALVIH